MTGRGATIAVVAMAATLMSCRQDMHDQPKFKNFRKTSFFNDKRSVRPVVEDTVARGQLRSNESFETGKSEGKPVVDLPVPLTAALMTRGRERYDIFCAPCHDRSGSGLGTVVRRGFRRPNSFHIDRLREAPPGYFYDVMLNGFGSMADYAAQIEPGDRWAIVAYIRALQLSQRAALTDVPEAKRAALAALPAPTPGPLVVPPSRDWEEKRDERLHQENPEKQEKH